MTRVEPFPEGQLVEGQLVGRYRIVRLIGEGGMGAVYEAVHVVLKKRVAVKMLLPQVAQNQDARARFLREGEAASRINHPHVVSVLDVGEDAGAPYLVMEYLEGRTLGDFLAEPGRGPLALEEAADLFLPVVAAVAAGHDSGVVHRDLKPQNILLARGRWGDLVPKVLDFGVSKLIDHQGAPVTRTQAVLGTACYMSPEQARGARNVEARSDQFALGLILYEMVTGQRAYRGANDLEILYSASAGVVQPAQQLRPDLPDDFHAVLNRMLGVALNDRFPHLRDGGRLLLPFASERTRTSIGGDFADQPSVVPSAAAAEVPTASAPKTALLPVATLELRQENTTLRHAAIESEPKVAGKSSKRPAFKLAIAIAIPAVVACAALIVWNASTDRAPAPAVVVSPPVVPAPAVVEPEPAPPVEIPTPPIRAPEPAEDRAERTPFEVRAFPPEAELTLDGRTPLRGRLELTLPLAGEAHEIRVTAPGYAPRVIAFGPDERPPAEIRLKPVAAPARRTAKKTARTPKPAQPTRGSNDALIIR
ncbi:MAG TPA: serine/threonine-protein kinase [Polyangia bacterium]|nr:serine/threonine-protein kinase [Polyangia bacterium]